MAARVKWSISKISKEYEQALNRPDQQEYHEKYIRLLEQFVTTSDDVARVDVAVSQLGIESSWESVVLLAAKKQEGVEKAHFAACAGMVADDITVRRALLADRSPTIDMAYVGFYLAALLAIGALADADMLYRFIITCLRSNMVGPMQEFAFPEYLLQLYARWKGEPLSLDNVEFGRMEAYGDLLAIWDTEDLVALAAAVSSACDLHIERSRPATSAKLFDFNGEAEWVCPYEIMALLRLREMRGLTNPPFDHPLLKLPTARLYPMRELPWNPLLVATYNKARTLLEEQRRSK